MGQATSTFEPDRDALDLKGKVAIVTGGNAGIGYWTVLHLRKRGAKVYLGARDEAKAKAAIESMNKIIGSASSSNEDGNAVGDVVYFHVDLEDPRLALKAAKEILEKEKRLDILVNNAGRIPTEYRLTKEGLVSTMVINHLSPFVFTRTLSPLLESTAREEGSDVRIVYVSSEIHSMVAKTEKYDSAEAWNNIYGSKTGYMAMMKRYGLSKLANILVANELQRRYDSEGVPITCISLHPGRVSTDTAIHDVSQLPKPISTIALAFMRWTFFTPDKGSYNSLYAAASPDIKDKRETYKGSFLLPIGKLSTPSSSAKDPVVAKTLWQTSESIAKDLYDIQL